MARCARAWVVLLALVTVTTGCIGPLADRGREAASNEDTEADALLGGQGEAPAAGDDGGPGLASVTLSLALTEDSRIPLNLQAVHVDLDHDEVRVNTVHGRLIPGQDAHVARLTAPVGTQIPETNLHVTFFDGLGQANFTAQIGAFELKGDAEQTIVLRDEGPSQIGYVTAEGPLDVEAKTEHAVPQYGYLLWPNGNRRALPGFDHVVHVPSDYPNIPAGQQASFLVEAPEDAGVLWRHEDSKPQRGDSFAFTPDPGQHHVRLSVGPGDSTTSLSVHTDYEAVLNGTVAASTPGHAPTPTVAPANGAEHAFDVQEDADHVSIVLRPVEPQHSLEDLDMHLEDDDGRTLAESSTENETLEVISYRNPRPGHYTVEITSEDGIAQDYSLKLRVNY